MFEQPLEGLNQRDAVRTVDDSVVEGCGNIDNVANHDLAVSDHGPVFCFVHTQDGDLRDG